MPLLIPSDYFWPSVVTFKILCSAPGRIYVLCMLLKVIIIKLLVFKMQKKCVY